jgi:hypothetical protein
MDFEVRKTCICKAVKQEFFMKCAKAILCFLALTVSFSARAERSPDDKQTTEILEALISNAKDIEYSYSGMIVQPPGKDISGILASAMMTNPSGETGDTAYVLDITSSCQDKTPNGLVGATQKRCSVQFTHKEMKKMKSGLKTDENGGQSGIIISADMSKVVYPGAKLQLAQPKAEITLLLRGI